MANAVDIGIGVAAVGLAGLLVAVSWDRPVKSPPLTPEWQRKQRRRGDSLVMLRDRYGMHLGDVVVSDVDTIGQRLGEEGVIEDADFPSGWPHDDVDITVNTDRVVVTSPARLWHRKGGGQFV